MELTNLETAVNPDDCLHCFCKEDTGGNLVCCKCGAVLVTDESIEVEK